MVTRPERAHGFQSLAGAMASLRYYSLPKPEELSPRLARPALGLLNESDDSSTDQPQTTCSEAN